MTFRIWCNVDDLLVSGLKGLSPPIPSLHQHCFTERRNRSLFTICPSSPLQLMDVAACQWPLSGPIPACLNARWILSLTPCTALCTAVTLWRCSCCCGPIDRPRVAPLLKTTSFEFSSSIRVKACHREPMNPQLDVEGVETDLEGQPTGFFNSRGMDSLKIFSRSAWARCALRPDPQVALLHQDVLHHLLQE